MVEMGLEPMTFRLLDECSNQLSYTTYTRNVVRLGALNWLTEAGHGRVQSVAFGIR